MTKRFFSGMRGGEGSGRKSAKDMFIDAKKSGKDFNKMSSEDRFKKMLNDKLDAIRSANKGKSKFNFGLPGAKKQEEKKVSKSVEEIKKKLEQQKTDKEAKKHAAKEKSKNIQIVPKYFTGMQGGKIDGNGNIFNGKGECMFTVDKKTGKIKNKMGNVVGKYEANSPFCEFRMAQLIAKSNTEKRGFSLLYQHGDDKKGGGSGSGKKGGTAWKGSVWDNE